MKKSPTLLILTCTLLPAQVMAHTGAAHSHPEEIFGGLGLALVIGLLIALRRR